MGFAHLPATAEILNYFVYVIQNSTAKFYIGLSDDVARRVQQHNDGISKWTRSKGLRTLVWTSEAMPQSEARKLENLLKCQKGGAGFYRITSLPARQAHNPATAGS